MLLNDKVHQKSIPTLQSLNNHILKAKESTQNTGCTVQLVHHFALTKVIYNANQIRIQMSLINRVIQSCFLEYMISSVCAHLLEKANRQLGGPS